MSTCHRYQYAPIFMRPGNFLGSSWSASFEGKVTPDLFLETTKKCYRSTATTYENHAK